MTKPATIKVDRHGVGCMVIDGVDVSMSVSPEFTLTGSTDNPAVLTLNLVGMNLEVDADADVQIPEDVATALESLGWVRPKSS